MLLPERGKQWKKNKAGRTDSVGLDRRGGCRYREYFYRCSWGVASLRGCWWCPRESVCLLSDILRPKHAGENGRSARMEDTMKTEVEGAPWYPIVFGFTLL